MEESTKEKLREHLEFLYGKSQVAGLQGQIQTLLDAHRNSLNHTKSTRKEGHEKFSEKDVILITYGDIIQTASQPALQSLKAFLDRYLNEHVNAVHLLPFFP